jgi:hypothetical protein
MRVMEIADYLMQRGLMRGKWTREVLRTGMRNKPEIFERIGEGIYALKSWPPEQKNIPGQMLSSLFPQGMRKDSSDKPNMQMTLLSRITELLEDTKRLMGPTEIGNELVRQGKATRKEVDSSLHSALSTLVKRGLINRPEQGRYLALPMPEKHLVNDESIQEGALISESEPERVVVFDKE